MAKNELYVYIVIDILIILFWGSGFFFECSFATYVFSLLGMIFLVTDVQKLYKKRKEHGN